MRAFHRKISASQSSGHGGQEEKQQAGTSLLHIGSSSILV
jgi:hypothetical protein